jgi:hypothetical protein
MTPKSRSGWDSDFPTFGAAQPAFVRERLTNFIPDASPEQVRAWRDSIPPLQEEVREVLDRYRLARDYSAILEYELPLESRRPDVVLLAGAGILVVELKGKTEPSQADIDQVAAYARDLRAYHRECTARTVVPVLVPTRARGYQRRVVDVHITGPDALDTLVADLMAEAPGPPLERDRFLDEAAYRPLPTLVAAARELLTSGTLRRIHRAAAATDPAVAAIRDIVHDAARTKTRRLVLLTGVPGAGKTLVGLQAVHAHYLDDLAVVRADGEKPTAPAVFLSGNGPLVEVLQYELRSAGGGGKTFVRGVKDYVKYYSARPGSVPPEHVLVFDEAQRAFDAEQVRAKHKGHAGDKVHKSEPEHFIEFAERIPGWCVVVGLIGGGQEIHVGEEAGLVQWRWAVERSPRSREWTVHAPAAVATEFAGSVVPVKTTPQLNLDTELRQHLARDLHRVVAGLLGAEPADSLAQVAQQLERDGFHLRLTRSLDVAKSYLRERYRDNPDARFGMLASSKDRDLPSFGVPNEFQATKNVRIGAWYGDPEESYTGRSCRRLDTCVTEFAAQGLELDATLLAWGTDFVMSAGTWSNAKARGYQRKAHVRNPFQLRVNAYRVLLTRARDACVVFVPGLPEMDETFTHLEDCGFKNLDAARPEVR